MLAPALPASVGMALAPSAPVLAAATLAAPLLSAPTGIAPVEPTSERVTRTPACGRIRSALRSRSGPIPACRACAIENGAPVSSGGKSTRRGDIHSCCPKPSSGIPIHPQPRALECQPHSHLLSANAVPEGRARCRFLFQLRPCRTKSGISELAQTRHSALCRGGECAYR